MQSVWLYITCPLCGDRVPVATEHEDAIEALEIHKRALHPDLGECDRPSG